MEKIQAFKNKHIKHKKTFKVRTRAHTQASFTLHCLFSRTDSLFSDSLNCKPYTGCVYFGPFPILP